MSFTPSSPDTVATAFIVEDELAMRIELRDQLRVLWPQLHIVGEAGDGKSALQQIAQCQPQVVFLDIQIPPPTGLEIARQLGNSCHLVFVSAYDAHAIEAFEKGALDYILKPINPARLAITVARLKQKLQAAPPDMSRLVSSLLEGLQAQVPARPRYLRWITASVGNSLRLITVDEIVFIQAERKYLRVVLANSEVLVRKTLKELLDELDPDQFWQIHRSTIANALEIANIAPNMAGRLTAQLKSRREQLPVSDTFIRKFREM
jgi:DNA-binding LytR/AlgR family response regulator